MSGGPDADEVAVDCVSALGARIDPMDGLLEEGGPWHVRGRLLEYTGRLRTTGRGRWADGLLDKHPREAAGEVRRGGF